MAGGPATGSYDGYASCPLTTARDKMLLAEFDYTMKPHPSLPPRLLDAQKERKDMWYLKRYGSRSCTEPHAQGPGLTAGRPTARSTCCDLVDPALEGHPGHVRADQQAQRPAQQAPEPGRVDGAVRDGLAVRGERHEKDLQRRGVGGQSGAEQPPGRTATPVDSARR